MDIDELASKMSMNSTKPWLTSAENKLSLHPRVHLRMHSTSSESVYSNIKNNEKMNSPLNTSPVNLKQLFSTLLPDQYRSKTPTALDLPEKNKKSMSLIERLNEEILILSTQLKQANEIISYLSNKISQFNTVNEESLSAIQDDFESRLNSCKLELENECNYLSNIIESLKKEHHAYTSELTAKFQKKFYEQEQENEQKLEKIAFEHKKRIVFIENHYIELIMNMNHKFIEETEYLQNCYRTRLNKCRNAERYSANCSDKEYEEGSTLFSPRRKNLKISRDHLVFSPLPRKRFDPRKPSESDCDLDLSLKHFFNQIK